jgi:outer membrane protein assembly factor BamB
VTGPPQARRVTVVGADGTLKAQRDLGDTSGMTVLPIPDGGLVVVSETRDELRWADVATGEPLDPSSDTATTYFFGSGDGRFSIRNSGRLGALAGPDTVVAVVDAATGAQRWTATIPFEPIADISGCVVLSWVVVPDAGSGEATGTSQAGGLSLQVTAWLSAPIIQINRCSQSFTFLLDGTQIRPSVLAERLAGDGSVVIDPDGGFLFTDAATGIAVLLDEQGVPRFTRTEADRRAWNTQFGLPLVAVPAAPGLADDPSGLSGLRLGFQGGKFTGFALDGSIRWVGAKLPAARSGTGPANTTVNKVLARVGTIGLVATGRNDELAAFDLTDGSLRWVQPAPEAVRAGDVVRAVTDGRTVVLLSTHFEPAPVGSAVQQYVLSYELTGIDLATGDMWSLPQEPGVPVDFVVVDGHVLAYYGSTAVEPWAVTVVADGPFAGETVIPQDGRLALLVPDEDPG